MKSVDAERPSSLAAPHGAIPYRCAKYRRIPNQQSSILNPITVESQTNYRWFL